MKLFETLPLQELNVETVARCLKELGHPTRLEIYRALIMAGEAGMPVGGVQRALNIPPSTLSHHIAALVSVGLVQQERQGRLLHCTAQYNHLLDIITFLLKECCAHPNVANGEDVTCAPQDDKEG